MRIIRLYANFVTRGCDYSDFGHEVTSGKDITVFVFITTLWYRKLDDMFNIEEF